MTKNIIFPLNNKGGVGKTSVMADLSAVLAQRHDVGIIDTDYQCSLGKTLLGRRDLGWKPIEFYRNFGASDVVLMHKENFSFSSALSNMHLDVAATRAKLALFPVGCIYREPESRKDLERIVSQDMAGDSFLAIDLPPMSDPYFILDHTIAPVIDAVRGDVRLFPLVISTPDHHVFEDGLEEFFVVRDYFVSRGVKPDMIHPFAVLNKVPLVGRREEDEDVYVYSGVDPATSRKFADIGLLYVSPTEGKARLNHVNDHFDYQGVRFRSVVIPLIKSVNEGRFALFLEEHPRLALFPHLIEMAKAYNYTAGEHNLMGAEKMYARALCRMSDFILSRSGVRPRKNYTKSRVVFDEKVLTGDTVAQLRQVLRTLYESGKSEYTERVTRSSGGSSDNSSFNIPKTLSLEQTADLIVDTQLALNGNVRLNAAEVVETLKGKAVGEYFDGGGIIIWGPNSSELLEISYEMNDPNHISVSVPRPSKLKMLTGLEVDAYLGKVEIFLRNLGRLSK